MKQHSPSAARNAEPIGNVLARFLPAAGTVLEIAAGTGEHAIAFARRFASLAWQPTDADASALASITAWRQEAALPNLRAPLPLDVNAASWGVPNGSMAAIVCINMIHISPWQSTLSLFAGAARALVPDGLLFLYGPFRFDGAIVPSNLEFEAWLLARDERYGVRDVTDLRQVAADHGFGLQEPIAMPANNHCLVFSRSGSPA